MIIPIRTDYRLSRTPVVNYILLGINVALFLAGLSAEDIASSQRISHLMLHPDNPQLYQFFTSVFLHAGWMHLLGNMVFLWVFGNAINDRFGNVGYLAFYLAGGVLAGVGYILLAGHAPVLGASGAISAVTGAYIVLFPRTRVTVLLVFYFITFLEVSSLYFLLFQVVVNLVMSFTPGLTGSAGGGVAYAAHSSGYIFGIGLSVALLYLRVLPRDVFDLLNLLRDARRRYQYRRMVSKGYDPFSYSRVRKPAPPRAARRVEASTVQSEPTAPSTSREMALRSEIREACQRHDLRDASRKYLQLVRIADDAVLSRQDQLDVANQLMADENYPAAADAYERFSRRFTAYEHMADIYLMLGLLYGRYLHQYDRAEQCLQQAVERLSDPGKNRLAQDELQAVRARRDG
jgi:membrane associated rhomboid family serine protease